MDKDVVHNEIMNDGVRNESSLSKTDKDELELTHNEIPQVNGLYIHGEANGEDTAYTINTDTSVSLLPANIYNDIHEELREVAVKNASVRVQSALGRQASVYSWGHYGW